MSPNYTTVHSTQHAANAIAGTGFLATFVSWETHLPLIIMTLSALATVAGVALQFWLAFGRQREMEQKLKELEAKLTPIP